MQMANDEESPFEPQKILVRDLAPNTTQDYLNRYFTQFADVTESIIPRNSVTGSPHSFGFVIFRYPAALRIPFILQLPHCIHDRCVEVSRALKGEDLQTLESQRKISTCQDNFERIGDFDKRKIFVQGWSPRPGITDDEFRRYFRGFGNVIDCCFWNDIGFGQITFRMKRGADRVLYRRSYILNGRRLAVNRLKRIPLDHINDARNPNVYHVNGTTREMQPQAATSESHTRNAQIIAAAESSGTDIHANDTRDIQTIPAAASFHTGHPPNNSARNHKQRKLRSAKNMQQEAAASSGADHVDNTTDMQPQAATNVSDTRDDMQIVLSPASSGADHVNSTTDMQPQAAASVRDTRDVQIDPAAASSGTDHVSSTTDMRPQVAESVSNTIDMQIVPAAARYGTDHVNSTQPLAAESVSSIGDMQIIPAAARSNPRNMQIIPAAARSQTGHPSNNSAHNRRWKTCPNAGHISASGSTTIPPSDQSIRHHHTRRTYMAPGVTRLRFPGRRTGHPSNNSAHNRRRITCPNAGHISASDRTTFPPSDQSIPHHHTRMTYMAPGVTRLRYPGHCPALHQAYSGMGIYTTATNNFPPAGVAHQDYNGMGIYANAANNFPPAGAPNFSRFYAGHGNFPMAPADYSNQDFNYYPLAPADYSNQDFNYYFPVAPVLERFMLRQNLLPH